MRSDSKAHLSARSSSIVTVTGKGQHHIQFDQYAGTYIARLAASLIAGPLSSRVRAGALSSPHQRYAARTSTRTHHQHLSISSGHLSVSLVRLPAILAGHIFPSWQPSSSNALKTCLFDNRAPPSPRLRHPGTSGISAQLEQQLLASTPRSGRYSAELSGVLGATLPFVIRTATSPAF